MSNPSPLLLSPRAIAFARAAALEGSAARLNDQLDRIRNFAKKRGMTIVDEISLVGPSINVENLTQRKLQQNDFDTVIVSDPDRLSRGAQNGYHAYQRLEQCGVAVKCLRENSSVLFENLAESLRDCHAIRYARQISKRAVFEALRRGDTQIRPAFGTDLLLVREDNGEPFHRVRISDDGTKLVFDPRTEEVLFTLPAGQKYQKQSIHRVELVPGDAMKIEAIRHVFRRRFVDGWSWARMAIELNDLGMLGPRGRYWKASFVRQLANNPVYCGFSVFGRTTSAVYFMIRRDGAAPATQGTPNYISLRRRYRSQNDWVCREHPKLKDIFMTAEIRAVATETIMSKYRSKTKPMPCPNE